MKTSVLLLLAAVVMLVGCNRTAESLGAANAKLFDTADPQIKAQWEAANAAIKTNGYAEAIQGFKELQAAATLTPAQRKAVDKTVTAVSDQMYTAANNGDEAAKAAIQKLRGASGR